MKRPTRWLALLAAMALAFTMTSSVFGYTQPRPRTVIVTPSRGTFTCGQYYTVYATVLDKKGHGIKGVRVTWSIARSPSSRDKIKTLRTRTGTHGTAKTRIKFACVRGDRKVRARINNVSGTAVIHVRIPRHNSLATGSTTATGAVLGVTSVADPGSLPSTSTMAPVVSTDGQPTPAIPALLAVLAGVALILRRFALSRR